MTPCCSRCRRGMPGMGGGCGQPACKCHWLEQNDPTEPRTDLLTYEHPSTNPDPAESHERRTA